MSANDPSILPSDLKPLLPSGCSLVDVREPVEHKENHIEGAKLIPLGQLEKRAGEIDRSAPVVVMCRSGRRGQEALKKLNDLGFEDVRNLEGGILAWKEAGHPVNTSDKKVFPLMQQVQLTIGLGVLIGATLTLTVNPNWVFLCAFFGAGLTLSGSTGWCGLALLMSKMPWNRVTAQSCCSPQKAS
ncbi:MAG: rhodanese-like domain-containing protein [Verrucomicrobiales bacterium]|jgi:rhodanese-related sulfurtransferase|nr:rhodanese-like domain-containing protein [Verrucomicrobiales bacterium]HQZ30002.1 rhodanese-like domain-containing protein [Verrucomicrobiales bacterium]